MSKLSFKFSFQQLFVFATHFDDHRPAGPKARVSQQMPCSSFGSSSADGDTPWAMGSR